jgi:hypothetical protein
VDFAPQSRTGGGGVGLSVEVSAASMLVAGGPEVG